jgi:hypothetical protein
VAHVPLQFLIREQLMLVGEDFLVASAEITHALAMRRLDVTMQIGPAQPGKIARPVGTVVPQQEDGVADNLLVGVFDADVAVGGGEIAVCVGLELLVGIVGKDNIRSWRLQTRSRGISLVPTKREGQNRIRESLNILGSGHNPWSCTAPSCAGRRYGMSCGCTAQSSGGRRGWRR